MIFYCSSQWIHFQKSSPVIEHSGRCCICCIHLTNNLFDQLTIDRLTSLTEDHKSKLETLKTILIGYDKVAIAYSGGVDSSLLLKVACGVLGENATAYFADSIVQTAEEKDSALAFAQEISAQLVILEFDILTFPDFVKNPVDRCYFCKGKIFSEIVKKAAGSGVSIVADGTNLDDLSQFRPGAKAVGELGVRTPLVEAKLAKKDIRKISKSLGLSNWNKYSSSCLATRIASGLAITPERLAIITKAEQYLQDRQFSGCRVRLDASSCVLELSSGDICRFINRRFEKDFMALMNSLGIDKVLLDLKEREGVNI